MAEDSGHLWQRVGRALVAAAAVALVVALVLVVREAPLLLHSASARGDVVGVERRQLAGTPLYAPVVRFPAAGGMHVFTGRPGSIPYRIGDAIEVRYDLRNPDRATADDLVTMWLPAVCALGAALVLSGVGSALLFAARGQGWERSA